jgi:hypothetical protein
MAIRHLQEKYSKYRTGPSTTTSNMQTMQIPSDMESPVPVMGGLLMAITAVAAVTDAVLAFLTKMSEQTIMSLS